MLEALRDILVNTVLFSLLKRPFIILYMVWVPLLKSEDCSYVVVWALYSSIVLCVCFYIILFHYGFIASFEYYDNSS